MSMLSFVAAASGGGALVRLGAARAPARLGRPGPPRNAVVASGGGGLLGRLLTAMSGSGGAAASSSASVAVPSPASVPSWADLEGTLPADAMEPDYVNGVARASPSWEDESVRLFGKDRKDVRLVLYRDKAYWCPYVAGHPQTIPCLFGQPRGAVCMGSDLCRRGALTSTTQND